MVHKIWIFFKTKHVCTFWKGSAEKKFYILDLIKLNMIGFISYKVLFNFLEFLGPVVDHLQNLKTKDLAFRF